MPFRGIVKRVNKKLRHGYITYHDIDYEIYVRFCDFGRRKRRQFKIVVFVMILKWRP